MAVREVPSTIADDFTGVRVATDEVHSPFDLAYSVSRQRSPPCHRGGCWQAPSNPFSFFKKKILIPLSFIKTFDIEIMKRAKVYLIEKLRTRFRMKMAQKTKEEKVDDKSTPFLNMII